MATMSRELYNELEGNGFNVRDNYSGKGMFGALCFGYDPDDGNLFLWFIQQLYNEGQDWEFYDEVQTLLDCDAFESQCMDSMGLGTIVYFPGLEVADAESEE